MKFIRIYWPTIIGVMLSIVYILLLAIESYNLAILFFIPTLVWIILILYIYEPRS